MTTAQAALLVSGLSFLVSALTFYVNVVLRGRRPRVDLVHDSGHLIVKARNDGATQITVDDWGFVVRSGARTFGVKPPNTGPNGPALPAAVDADGRLDPCSQSVQDVVVLARGSGAPPGEATVRGFITLRGGKHRKTSPRRARVKLTIPDG